MAQRVIDGFILEEAVVLCPDCQSPFRTEVLVETRPLNSTDVVEADLHRVFPDAAIRAALLSLCPECKYCAWASQFKPFNIKAELVKRETEIEPCRKYALAVKSARQRQIHSLDIAFIALNGLWCARESSEPDALWLELSIFEHEKGMENSPTRPEDDGITHLIMGELYRQSRNFEAASEHYNLAAQDKSIVKEVLEHQRSLTAKGLSTVTAIPLRIVRILFDLVESDGTSLTKEIANAADEPVFVPMPSRTSVPAKRTTPSPAAVTTAPVAHPAAPIAVFPATAPAASAPAAAAAAQAPAASPQVAPVPVSASAASSQSLAAKLASIPDAPSIAAIEPDENEDDGAPLVAAISALFSANSVLFSRDEEEKSATAPAPSPAAKASAPAPVQKPAAQAPAQSTASQHDSSKPLTLQQQVAIGPVFKEAPGTVTPAKPAAVSAPTGAGPIGKIAHTNASTQNPVPVASTPVAAAPKKAPAAPAPAPAPAPIPAPAPKPVATPAPIASAVSAEAAVKPALGVNKVSISISPAQDSTQAPAPAAAGANADANNVIEIKAYEEAQKPPRPNSAARAAAVTARAKSVGAGAAAQQAAQATAEAAPKKRRSTRKDRRKQERSPGAQNTRSDHRVTRLPIGMGVVNAKGWITDYADNAIAIIPAPQAQSQSSGSEGLHDYEIVGLEDEKKEPLPAFAIDDPNGYKGEDVPDYTDAISRVENYLSFSRKLYQSGMRGYN